MGTIRDWYSETPRLMGKVDDYRRILSGLPEWEPYLLENSGLPGPRGNLELAHAVADLGDKPLFLRLLRNDPGRAPTNDPREFLAFCGVLGLGRLLAEGDRSVLARLRERASDPRWRVREAVAMALQRWGVADMRSLLEEMRSWVMGGPLEMRAAAAGLCEPRLLHDESETRQVLEILGTITANLAQLEDRTGEPFRALRKGLAYCWSVAVAAHPDIGKRAMERWLTHDDKHIRWVMRENLKKKRLARMDADWVSQARAALEQVR